MDDFENYFSFYLVVDQLCLYRAKLSFYTHKNSYLNDYCKIDRWKVGDQHKIQDIEFLKRILPPRKHWSRPSKNVNRQKYTSSIELNKISIKNRVFIHHKDFISGKVGFKQTPVWYQNLRYFLFELRLEVFGASQICIRKPDIFPAKKKPDLRSDIERRPLAKFMLSDKLILSLTNKYLTKIFDNEFLDSSFAFRSRNSLKNGPTYHDAVGMLQEFRVADINKDLYIAECDIKKFFDCLDHEIIGDSYLMLTEKLAKSGLTIHPKAQEIFFAYLACYSFNHDVYPKNNDSAYWIEHNDFSPKGRFGWVKELDVKENTDGVKKIGVPQGGALSGLIVNILLHKADILMEQFPGWGRDFLYLRYCDDMVIVHSSPDSCGTLFKNYISVLTGLKLITHDAKTLTTGYSKKFWGDDVKSRNVYLWSKKRTPTMPNSPWISFLGYMIHYNGELKVRKKSIVKQEKKHDLEVKRVIKKLNKQGQAELLEHKASIIQSFETKLYSMAVGKVDIENYKNVPVDMCWAAGFRLITENRFTKIQLQRLDKSRKEAVHVLKRYLKRRTAKLEAYLLEIGQLKKNDKTYSEHEGDGQQKKKTPKIINSKYPHSFYSILERPKRTL